MKSYCRTILFTITSLTCIYSLTEAEYSVTDLVEAAKRGDYHAVHKLIENGSDLDARGPMDFTALHWAGIRGHWRIVEELVAAGAPVNAVGSDGGTPLHWVCHHDRPDAVRLLLDAGADVSVQNRWGRTPLHVAARRGCVEVAEMLIDAGADPNATTNEGWTPMHVAAKSGHVAILDLLESRGADPTRRDSDGLTPCRGWRRRPSAIEATLSAPDDYVGIYDLGQGFTIKVWNDKGHLHLREFAPDGLVPVREDEFVCLQEPWRVRFLRDERGSVHEIEVQFLRRTVRGTKRDDPRYIGSQACVSCHTGSDSGRQAIVWLQSRHSHAYWRLESDWALFLGHLRPQYDDLETPATDERCTLCHVAGSQDPDAIFASSYRTEEGVGCEACHGPGSKYATEEIMSDRDAFLANGGRIPDAGTCTSCHRNSDNFDWAELWPKIAHPKPQTAAETDG